MLSLHPLSWPSDLIIYLLEYPGPHCLGAGSVRAADKHRWILALNVSVGDELHYVARLTGVELCAQTRLAEPRSNRSADDGEGTDDLVQVVSVGEIRVVGVRVEV